MRLALPNPASRTSALLLACAFFAAPEAPAQDRAEDFARAAADRIEAKPSVRGDDDDWFFLVRELRHLAAGAFWEKPWQEVARNGTDPVPSMIEFHGMLREKGIKLVVVPIPAKADLYPEKLADGFTVGDAVSLRPFLERLEEGGITVVDLQSILTAKREETDEIRWYCQQDAHYSPATIELLADEIRNTVPDLAAEESGELSLGEAEDLTIVGDQVRGSEWESSVPAETLVLRRVFADGTAGITPDPASPFLLLGDSHSLVFHEGAEAGMHCRGGGLVDHLSLRFGSAFDLVGVRGSGLVQARKQLFFHAANHPGYWDSKRLVVWVFSVRELTQSTDRILPIPLERP